MGKIDLAAHVFFQKHKECYAELFNRFVFQKDIVDPDLLTPVDAKYSIKRNKTYRSFLRDELCQLAVIQETKDFGFILLGCENFSYTNYRAPVVAMTYDAMEYQRQSAEIYERHRKEGRTLTGAEFLSRYPKGAYLKPVITLIWNLQPIEWDGPTNLKQMIQPELADQFGQYFNDYGVTVIDPTHITEEALNHLSNNLRAIMGYSKYSQNPDELYEFVSKQVAMSRLDPVTADLINLTTHSKLDLSKYEEEGVVNMCKAIQIMQEGKKKAEAENRQLKAENRQAKAETRQVRAELMAENRQVKAENKQVKAELNAERKEHNREKKLLIKMLKESGRSEAEIKSYLNSAALASA